MLLIPLIQKRIILKNEVKIAKKVNLQEFNVKVFLNFKK